MCIALRFALNKLALMLSCTLNQAGSRQHDICFALFWLKEPCLNPTERLKLRPSTVTVLHCLGPAWPQHQRQDDFWRVQCPDCCHAAPQRYFPEAQFLPKVSVCFLVELLVLALCSFVYLANNHGKITTILKEQIGMDLGTIYECVERVCQRKNIYHRVSLRPHIYFEIGEDSRLGYMGEKQSVHDYVFTHGKYCLHNTIAYVSM